MEAFSIIKLLISVLKSIHPVSICKKIKNLWCRPKLKIDIQHQTAWFSKDNLEKKHYPCFCVAIENTAKKVLHVNLNKIFINNEKYQGISIPEDFQFSESKICEAYKEKWVEIVSGNVKYPLKPFNTEILPFKPVEGAISVTLEIDNKTYEYGINRIFSYGILINYLAFYHQNQF